MIIKKKIAMPKVPANVGAAIDALDALRTRRKALEMQAKVIASQEAHFENEIFKKFKKSELEGARGKVMQASIERTVVPTLVDPKKLYAYIRKTGEFDLLHQRLGARAVQERWNAGKTVPGVGTFNKISLHLTKVKAKKPAGPPRGKGK